MTFSTWRLLHRIGAGILGAFGVLHSSLTFIFYDEWTPDAVWFLGTGFALALLAAINWAHVGLEPCNLPTAKVVRWANVVFMLFGVAAVIAVPEPQAFVILAAIGLQTVAGLITLRHRDANDFPKLRK